MVVTGKYRSCHTRVPTLAVTGARGAFRAPRRRRVLYIMHVELSRSKHCNHDPHTGLLVILCSGAEPHHAGCAPKPEKTGNKLPANSPERTSTGQLNIGGLLPAVVEIDLFTLAMHEIRNSPRAGRVAFPPAAARYKSHLTLRPDSKLQSGDTNFTLDSLQ